MTPPLKPLKGVQFPLTQKFLDFIAETLEDIDAVYDDGTHDDNPKRIQDDLAESTRLAQKWEVEDDSKIGRKVSTAIPYGSNDGAAKELRITVILTKKGELRLDIRPWGVY